jgi:thiamine biosynthesis protein ThiI
MHPPGADTVVVRYGDASVKSGQVQGRMERQLADNLRALLADRDVPGTVERRWARPLIRTEEAHVEAATDAATDAYGVVSASPAVAVTPELEPVVDAVAAAARATYESGTFAVDARRADKDLPFTSEDVAREAGSAVFDAVEQRSTSSPSAASTGAPADIEPEVDLDDPDHTFHVEVREDEAFVFTEKRPGPGGLPLGSQGRLVALVSGGIDSPVAAYEVMKRGSPVVPVYLDLGAYGGPDHRARAMETVRSLTRFAPDRDWRTWVVPAGDAVDRLVGEMDRGRMLSYRRFMYRVGQAVAERTGAHGIVTGEAVGQKSSQTATNLGVVSRAADLPIHRPLLTMDKPEITERAKEIGTFEDSSIPAGCYRIAPDQVETNADLARLLEHEPDDLFELAADAVERAERVDMLGAETVAGQ